MSEAQHPLSYTHQPHHPFESASLALFQKWCAPPQTAPYAAPETPYVQRLTSKQFPQASRLINQVRGALGADQQHFLKPKSPLDLTRLDRGGGAVFGYYNDRHELVALTVAERRGIPTIAPAFNAAGDAVVLLQSVCTREDYRNKGALKAIFAEISRWATGFETPVTLIAKVAADNHKSLQLFTGNGFALRHIGWDIEKNYKANIMAKTVDRAATSQNPPCLGLDYAV